MSSPSEIGLPPALAAALTLFSRYGFQRTSMADVAREAGIARATLYLRFSDKRALFAALAASLVEQALADAEAAWRDDAALSANIAAVLLAKDLRFFHLHNATPHGAEMLAVDTALTAAQGASMDDRFIAALAARGAALQQDGVDFGAFGGPQAFAAFLATTGAALKHELRSEASYRDAIERLGRVAARAAGRD